MKKLLLLALATLLTFGVANAQLIPVVLDNPFGIYFGNIDGSDVEVTLDSDIEIDIFFGQQEGHWDTINFMHVPVASDDTVITSRDGGTFDPFFDDGGYEPFWDDLS